MDRSTRIAVVGGGLAGLAVAGFLQRDGFSVTVYEQSEAFSRIGAGIILSANASRVLQGLGVADALHAHGIQPDAYVSRAWDSGERMFELRVTDDFNARYGAPYLNIHRADLHVLLQKPLAPGTIRFGHHLTGLEPCGEGVRLSFENGASAEADIVLGADGIRSRVRAAMLGPDEPRFFGRVAPRAVFPASRIPAPAMEDCTKWWGEDRHILTYFMTSRRDEVYAMGTVPAESWDMERTVMPGTRDDFLAAFAHFHHDLTRILEVAENVTIWPLLDRARDDRWSEAPVALMGDACHAMRPYMAAGGAMALEDAAILSRCLARFDDAASAFSAYEATRIDRVALVQEISIANTWMRGPHEGDWFFGYDPLPADLAAPVPA